MKDMKELRFTTKKGTPGIKNIQMDLGCMVLTEKSPGQAGAYSMLRALARILRPSCMDQYRRRTEQNYVHCYMW